MSVLEGVVSRHRIGQFQPLQHWWLVHKQITVMLKGLPWIRFEIILSFFRLYPSTAFPTLLLTMRAIPFLLRDSCPQ